jgi:hypothetical protein
MATKKIRIGGRTTGLATYYAVLIANEDGSFYNVSASQFQAFVGGNWADYAIPLTEFGASGIYYADSPDGADLTAAAFDVMVYSSTGTPTLGDVFQGNGTIGASNAVVDNSGTIGGLLNNGSETLSISRLLLNSPSGAAILITSEGKGIQIISGEDGVNVISSNGKDIFAPNSEIGGLSLADDAVTSLVIAVWDAATTALSTVGSIGKFLVDKLTGVAQTGDVQVTVTPLQASTVSAGEVSATDATVYQYAGFNFTWPIIGSDGSKPDLRGKECKLVVFDYNGSTLFELDCTGVGNGTDHNQVSGVGDDSHSGLAGRWRYVIRNTTDDSVIARGLWKVERANDAT